MSGNQSVRDNRVTHATQETEDVPPLARCVKTLPEAVQLSLKDGVNERCLFTFARALKAFEITTGTRLSPDDLARAFSLWWNTTKPQLLPEADFDEYRFVFEDVFARTRSPLGANHLREAIRRADTSPPPPEANRYTSPRLKQLVAVCYHLQRLQGDAPFFLSIRDAADVLGTKRLEQASAMLAGLIRDGILIEIAKGAPGGGRATRFRFQGAQPQPAGASTPPGTPKAADRPLSTSLRESKK